MIDVDDGIIQSSLKDNLPHKNTSVTQQRYVERLAAHPHTTCASSMLDVDLLVLLSV